MNRPITIRLVLACGFLALVSLFFLFVSRSRSGDTTKAIAPSAVMPTLCGVEAIEHLKQQGSYQSLQEAMAAIKYEARWQPKPLLEGIEAAQELSNRANNLLAYVSELLAAGLAKEVDP